MSYAVDVDPLAEQQISALPRNKGNSGGAVRQLPFGQLGMITYLILEDQRRVDLLLVTWAG